MKQRLHHAVRATLVIGAALLAGSCTHAVDIAGGGSDMPNGMTVAGVISTPDGQPCADCMVELQDLIVTAQGDSLVRVWTDSTDAAGFYHLPGIPAGRYTLQAHRSTSQALALNQRLEVTPERPEVRADLRLKPPVTLRGRMLLPEGLARPAEVRIFVPGTSRNTTPNDSGMYQLEHMPQGAYDIAFTLQSTANFTSIDIAAQGRATLQLWDIEFAMVAIMADGPYNDLESTCRQAYYITPRRYADGQLPTYLDTVDTGLIVYYQHDSTSGAMYRWRHTSAGNTGAYDLSVAGHLHAGTGDTALLVRSQRNDTLRLTGALILQFDRQGEFVIAGIRLQTDTPLPGAVYEVVFMEMQPDDMKDTEWYPGTTPGLAVPGIDICKAPP